MRCYKNLFFDLDDTLWYTAYNSRETFHEIYDRFEMNRYFDSFEHFYNIYLVRNNHLWADYALGKVTKEELNHERFLYPLQTVGIDDEELAKRYSEQFFKTIPYKKRLIPHALELLDYLRDKKKYHLHILSNGFREMQFTKMESSGIRGYFDKIVLSDDIGISKPAKQFFDFALSVTRGEYDNSLMIGDNWVNDIEGARNAGIDQLFFNRLDEHYTSFHPTYEVSDLREIIQIL